MDGQTNYPCPCEKFSSSISCTVHLDKFSLSPKLRFVTAFVNVSNFMDGQTNYPCPCEKFSSSISCTVHLDKFSLSPKLRFVTAFVNVSNFMDGQTNYPCPCEKFSSSISFTVHLDKFSLSPKLRFVTNPVCKCTRPIRFVCFLFSIFLKRRCMSFAGVLFRPPTRYMTLNRQLQRAKNKHLKNTTNL